MITYMQPPPPPPPQPQGDKLHKGSTMGFVQANFNIQDMDAKLSRDKLCVWSRSPLTQLHWGHDCGSDRAPHPWAGWRRACQASNHISDSLMSSTIHQFISQTTMSALILLMSCTWRGSLDEDSAQVIYLEPELFHNL